MFKKSLSILAMMALFVSPMALSQDDWGIDEFDAYDGAFYDTTTSDLYDYNDDWFYDSYTYGVQEEEDVGIGLDDTYDWEADTDLFADEGL